MLEKRSTIPHVVTAESGRGYHDIVDAVGELANELHLALSLVETREHMHTVRDMLTLIFTHLQTIEYSVRQKVLQVSMRNALTAKGAKVPIQIPVVTDTDPTHICVHPDCGRGPATVNGGYPLFRTSPPSEPFQGKCIDHIGPPALSFTIGMHGEDAKRQKELNPDKPSNSEDHDRKPE